VRFRLIAGGASYFAVFCIASVHNFLLRIMPLRTGEFAFAILAKRTGAAGLGQSLLSLLHLRVLDISAVLVLFGGTLALNRGLYHGDVDLGLLVASLLAVVGVVLTVLFNRLLRVGAAVLRLLVRWLRLRPGRIVSFLDRLDAAVAQSNLPRSLLLLASAYTFVLWGLDFFFMFLILRTLAVPVGPAQILLGGTAAVVGSFIPSGIGSFGTMEAGWALGFVLVGLEPSVAVASGLAYSVATLLLALPLAILGWVGLAWRKRRRPLENGR